MIQSVAEYMEMKRKVAHALASDDHWFVSTTVDCLSMYPASIPWHVSENGASAR